MLFATSTSTECALIEGGPTPETPRMETLLEVVRYLAQKTARHSSVATAAKIEILPDFGRWVRPIDELANTPFEPTPFRAACEAIAPVEHCDDYQWRFAVSPDIHLLVGVDAKVIGRDRASGYPVWQPLRILCAVLSVCGWENCQRSDHATEASYLEQRRQFDAVYASALDQAIGSLGQPLLQGADNDESGHRWALWRGRTGLFIVQQSAYDPQFGDDVNYWVRPWSGPDPRPSAPFIDWLMQDLARTG